ncbi:Rieske 2Fe-2S family protein [Quadrisphaera granulorum]|uniref:Rieske 2Fe-2S family protein n=1 Tax=Quadrisphaera granulorum TaxID=317664 RepID=A0A316AUV1_9ACTN|nr:aromatic ring-hydroxylating dioxygenase subunit alpha [Quadrisphaera granulorum]PWJ53877.1 Rieske 2Fe-2S family protein [Quadrisphaera granulorum]SZE96634.1 Rieske 2Fe-2S family protein [Quadrisphaera granulorum]
MTAQLTPTPETAPVAPAGSSTPSAPTALGTSAAELVARRRKGYSLEGDFYTSREIYDLDVDVVFSKNWIFVAAAAEIPEAGDYVTVDIGKASVVVVRDDDDEITAFHNVCRHRGSRLLEDKGFVGNIVCPYHRWTYALDGSLLHAESQPPGFDKSCFSLHKVHVRNLAGLVFICLAQDAPADFDEVAKIVEPHLRPYQLDKAKVARQIDLPEAGNWKLVMENNRECYHCDGHPELISAFFPIFGYSAEDITPRLQPIWDRYTAAKEALAEKRVAQGTPLCDHQELDTRPVGFQLEHFPLEGESKSFAAGGAALCSKLIGDVKDAAFGDISMHLQPNCWFHFLGDHCIAFSVMPTSPTTSVLRTTWLVNPDAEEGTDYDLESLCATWNATNDQDRTLVTNTQIGCSDPAYVPGPYSMVEDQVEAFVNWYMTRLREHLGLEATA